MPTPIAFTIDDLDAEIKAQKPSWANRSDFDTLRNLAYRRALSEYEEALFGADDIFARADTIDSPIAIGTEKINTSTGDVYSVALPTGAVRVAGNNILVELASSATFANVPRMSWDDIVASGTSQTPYAFWEKNGKIVVYVKDTGAFVNTASVVFSYYRDLDATQTTATALDIKHRDFATLVADTIGFLDSYV